MNISWSLTDEQLEAAMEKFEYEDLADLRDQARSIADEALNEEVLD